jgi:hypothetical protein
MARTYLLIHYGSVKLLLTSSLENSYLNEWSGSCTEYAFGIKRVNNKPRKISSLIGLVLIPSINRILDNHYGASEPLMHEMPISNETQINESNKVATYSAMLDFNFIVNFIREKSTKLKNMIHKFLNMYYKSLSAFAKSAEFILKILYMFNLTNHHNIWSFLTGYKLERLTMNDYVITFSNNQRKMYELSIVRQARSIAALGNLTGFSFFSQLVSIGIDQLLHQIKYFVPM